MKVFLDINGECLGVCTKSNRTLAEAQAKNPSINSMIDNAPMGLKVRTSNSLSYHKKTSGDGTDISHYTDTSDISGTALSLTENKTKKHDEVKDRTNYLLDNGSFTHDGKEFRLSDRAIVRWIGVGHAELRTYLSFPFNVTAKDYSTYTIPNVSDWHQFFGAGLTEMTVIETIGRAIHTQIIDATTQAELDAVVDNR